VIVRRSQAFRAVTLARILTGSHPDWQADDLNPPPCARDIGVRLAFQNFQRDGAGINNHVVEFLEREFVAERRFAFSRNSRILSSPTM
jgi:hypothetical protein